MRLKMTAAKVRVCEFVSVSGQSSEGAQREGAYCLIWRAGDLLYQAHQQELWLCLGPVVLKVLLCLRASGVVNVQERGRGSGANETVLCCHLGQILGSFKAKKEKSSLAGRVDKEKMLI